MTEQELDIKLRILYAAKKLFAQQGYDGTSVRQICDEAGANISLISYHFGGKEMVFRAIFERFFTISISDDSLQNDNNISPVEELILLTNEIIHFGFSDREMSDIVKYEMSLLTNRTPIVYPFLEPIRAKLSALLHAGKEQGIFQIDSVKYGMLQVLSVILAHRLAHNDDFTINLQHTDLDNLVQQTTKFILLGLGVNPNEYK